MAKILVVDDEPDALEVLGFNLKMSMLMFTLNRCWSDLSSFLSIFFFFIFAFVQMFYFMLYSQLADFREHGAWPKI